MTTEWIEPFQDAITHFHQHFCQLLNDQTLADHLPLADRGSTRWYQWIVGRIFLWSRCLPLDEATWSIINMPVLRDQMTSQLSGVRYWVQRWEEAWKKEGLPRPTVLDDLFVMHGKALNCLYQMQTPWLEPEMPFQILSPYTVRDALLVHASQWTFFRSVRTRTVPEGALIHYHPYHVHYLLTRLIDQFTRDQRLYRTFIFTMRGTPRFLDLIFTSPALRLTPPLWDTLMANLEPDVSRRQPFWISIREDSYEVLREMGGLIEPFLWNRSCGEGVIVRLPWVGGTQ